jgi:hypothetical protein
VFVFEYQFVSKPVREEFSDACPDEEVRYKTTVLKSCVNLPTLLYFGLRFKWNAL